MKRSRGETLVLGQKRTAGGESSRNWEGADKRPKAQEVQKRTKTVGDERAQKRSRGEELVTGQKRERGQGEPKRTKEIDQLKRIRKATREPD